MKLWSLMHVSKVICSLLIIVAMLTVIHKTSRSNVTFMNDDSLLNKPQPSRTLEQQGTDDTWKKTMEDKFDALKKSLEMLWCESFEVQSNGGFCVTEKRLLVGGNQAFDTKLCSAVETLAGHGSIGDLGAGLGWYGMCLLREKDVPFVISSQYKAQLLTYYKKTMGTMYNTTKVVSTWDGFDGAGNIEKLSGGFVRHADLSRENLWLGRQWDWVISVEVGEHISASSEKAFLDNLVRHACKGILLTWAIEGQGGHNHVNEQNNDYIRARMKERGLVNDIEEDNRIRKQLIYFWIKNTLMVFRFPENKKCL